MATTLRKIAYRDHDAVRWYDLKSGSVVREAKVAKPHRVAMLAAGSLLVLGAQGVVRVNADDTQVVVVEAKQLVAPVALAWDQSNQTFLVANGAPDNRILRFSSDGKLVKSYGAEGGRVPGPYFPDRFAEIADLAADNGRFYVVEGGEAGGGLRRISLVGEDGKLLDERSGGAEFFSCATAVPGNPREVYYSSCPGLIGRYDFDPDTGKNRLTHLFAIKAPLFPSFAHFPHYKPVVRKGQVYLVSCGTGAPGAFIVRPDPKTGALVPVALAGFKPWGGWSKDKVPEPIAKAATHHAIDPVSYKASAYTWSDANGNGVLDPEDLKVYYTFDDADLATGTIRNEAGPEAALTVQAYMHTMPALVPGMAGCGEALTFPKGRESVASRGGLSLTDYTVAFWFKATKGADTIGICQSGADYFLQNGAMVANQGGWYSHQPAGANLADGQWHHVAFTWIMAKRQQELYVNGVLVATNHGPQGGGHSGGAGLGRANTGGAFIGGCLDEFRIYARCLSAADVQTLARGTRAPH